MRPSVPRRRRRVGTNPISSRARIRSNNRTLHRVQTRSQPRRKRSLAILFGIVEDRAALMLLPRRGFRESNRIYKRRDSPRFQAQLVLGMNSC